MKVITKCLAGKLSVVLVAAMLISIIAPAYADAPGKSIVISSFTDSAGSLYISAGKGEGVAVGTKGVIMQNGAQIANYEVVQMNWGISRIKVSDLAAGCTIHAGDSAPITSAPTSSKKSSKSGKIWKALGIAAAVALVYMLVKGSNDDDDSSSATMTVKSEPNNSDGGIDDTVSHTITVTLKESDGDFVADGTKVTFATTAGSISPTETTTNDGKATATLTKDDNESATEAEVTVKALGKTKKITVSFDSCIELSATATAMQIKGSGGSVTSSTITAKCYNSKHELVTSDGTVKFTSDIGDFSDDSVDVGADGTAQTTFTSTEAGTATITATWKTSNTQTVDIKITAGPPSHVEIGSDVTEVECDGSSQAKITATVTDAGGNKVEDDTVVTFTTSGSSGATFAASGTNTTTVETTEGVATTYLVSKNSSSQTCSTGTSTVNAQVLATQENNVPKPASDITSSSLNITFTEVASSEVASIQIGASPTNIRGWDLMSDTTTLTALVRNASNVAVPDGTVVTFSVSHGIITTTGTITTTGGTATATLKADASGDSSWTGLVDVTASSEGYTETESGKGLVIFSGYPYATNCSYTISDTTLAQGDGATIDVTVQDINGHPVTDTTEVTASTTKGTLSSSSSTTSNGEVSFTLSTSSDVDNLTPVGDGIITITIKSGNSNYSNVKYTINFTVN